MSAVAKIDITALFADDSTAKITIDNIRPEVFNSSQIELIRSQCMQFNNQQGGTLAAKMKSKNGFNWVGIKKAQITITDKTILF